MVWKMQYIVTLYCYTFFMFIIIRYVAPNNEAIFFFELGNNTHYYILDSFHSLPSTPLLPYDFSSHGFYVGWALWQMWGDSSVMDILPCKSLWVFLTQVDAMCYLQPQISSLFSTLSTSLTIHILLIVTMCPPNCNANKYNWALRATTQFHV